MYLYRPGRVNPDPRLRGLQRPAVFALSVSWTFPHYIPSFTITQILFTPPVNLLNTEIWIWMLGTLRGVVRRHQHTPLWIPLIKYRCAIAVYDKSYLEPGPRRKQCAPFPRSNGNHHLITPRPGTNPPATERECRTFSSTTRSADSQDQRTGDKAGGRC